jgi:hypothetical protein
LQQWCADEGECETALRAHWQRGALADGNGSGARRGREEAETRTLHKVLVLDGAV